MWRNNTHVLPHEVGEVARSEAEGRRGNGAHQRCSGGLCRSPRSIGCQDTLDLRRWTTSSTPASIEIENREVVASLLTPRDA